MRITPFARVALIVSTGFIVAPAFAYAPPMQELDVPAAAAPGPTMRPTTGGKGGLPPHLSPNGASPGAVDEPAEEEGDEEAMPGAPAAAPPFAGRAHARDIRYGEDGLPAPVAALRSRLLDAAKSGEIERLAPILEGQPAAPRVVPLDEDAPDDPVEALRSQSGDEDGREILAILIELLEAGFVEVRNGSEVTYVWPYFAEVPLTELSPKNYVELYRVLTAVDVEDMMRDGRYGFFRVGISVDGRLLYFSAGDF